MVSRISSLALPWEIERPAAQSLWPVRALDFSRHGKSSAMGEGLIVSRAGGEKAGM
jgi:hypothetical protein